MPSTHARLNLDTGLVTDELLPRLEVDGGDWYEAVPPPVIPVPAPHVPDLAHRAAMLSTSYAVAHDMRVVTDAQQDHDGVWRVDIAPEIDYWRGICDAGPVTYQRVPLPQVWVEQRLTGNHPHAPADTATALLRRLTPDAEHPGWRWPEPARTTRLHGRRLIQVSKLGFAWDLRAVSDPYETPDGTIVVNIASTRDYFRWICTGHAPHVTPVPIYLLWAE